LHPSLCSRGKKVLPQTDGRPFCKRLQQGRRSAERRTTVAAPDTRAQPRSYADRSPFGAPPRLCAGLPRLGLGRASWNHRIQTGGPSPAPVQRAPRSPITRRTGRCPDRLKAEVTNSCLQEPLPLHQSVSPADVPHDERDESSLFRPCQACQGIISCMNLCL
jgi:hypothetical protein